MKVLITGACGFAGSSIGIWLSESFGTEFEVIGIDNFVRPGSWRNLQRLRDRGISVIHGDIRLPSDLERLGPVDWIIDAAAEASVLAGMHDTRRLMENNLLGTINLLELCKLHSAGFTLLSTSRVYSIAALASIPLRLADGGFAFDGERNAYLSEHGITEDFPTTAPISLYGSTKLASEQIALEYGLAFDFPVWINRCGVLAGAGQFGKADQGIFAYWLHSWRENRPLRYIGFEGNGHQVRDVLHPRDLAILVAAQVLQPEISSARVLNVSGGQHSSISLRQLSQWCDKRWGTRNIEQDLAVRKYDLPWVVLDHSAATRCFGWQPAVDLDSILKEIADFADDHGDWISRCT
ncbi:MAG: NAD-dependent epimerase/dehydratase family protein [Planctomycetota bacterium]